MKNKKQRRQRSFLIKSSSIMLLAFIGGAGFVMSNTRPETIGLLGVTGVFLLIYGAFSSFFLLIYSLRLREKTAHYGGIIKVMVLGLAPVMLLALSSTSPLGALDFLLVFSFEVAAIFYVDRIT